MKKLLSLISVVTIASAVPTTTLAALAKPPLTQNEINSSEEVVKSLLASKNAGLNTDSVLQYDENKDPNANTEGSIATGINELFNPDNFNDSYDVTKMLDSSSKITDDNSGTTFVSSVPSSLENVYKILNTLDESNINTQSIMELLTVANVPKMLGQFLVPFLGQNNIITQMLSIVTPSAFQDIENNMQKYSSMTYFTPTPNADGKQADDFGTASGSGAINDAFYASLGSILSLVNNGASSLKKADVVNIGTFVTVLINYISQFNFVKQNDDSQKDTNKAVNQYLFDANEKISNSQTMANINSENVKTLNLKNIIILMENLAASVTNTNDTGLGEAQLISVLFGNGSNNPLGINKVANKTDIADLRIVPDIEYYNPIMNLIQNFAPLAVSVEKLIKDPNVLNTITNDKIIEQLITLLGSLMNNISSNNKIDNSLNMITYLSKTIGTIMNKISGDNSSQYKKIMTDLNQLVTDIKNNKSWSSQDNTYTGGFDQDDFNTTYPIIDPASETGGTTFNDLWSNSYSKLSFKNDIANVFNDVTGLVGLKVKYDNNFSGLHSYIMNIMQNNTVGNTTLTYEDLVQSLDDKNGILQILEKDSNQIVKMSEQLIAVLNDKSKITEVQNFIKANLDTSKFDATTAALWNGGKCNLLDGLAILSIATSNPTYILSTSSTTVINTEIYSLIGFDSTKGQASDPTVMNIYNVINNNFNIFSDLVWSSSVSIGGVVNDLRSDWTSKYNTFMNDSNWSITKPSEDGKGNYSYTLTEKDNSKTYNVELISDSSDAYYKLAVS